MTPLSQTILEQYQTRKTKKQKSNFIRLMQQNFPDIKIQKGGFPRCRNLIIGDIESAKVVLTAHYDTCSQLPFPNFIAPKNPLLSILYSILLILPVFVIACGLNLILDLLAVEFWISYWLSLSVYMLFLILLLAGPANKHTANDNTSGVILLCELLQTLDAAQRSKAAFVLFDHEETGLIGSSYFRSRYRKEMKGKLLINFDCVSDGDHILVAANKTARAEYGSQLKQSFLPTEEKSILFTNAEKTYYPSDQAGFKQHVAVAALKRKKYIGYYLDRIHTSKDTAFDRRNITLICNGVLQLLKRI